MPHRSQYEISIVFSYGKLKMHTYTVLNIIIVIFCTVYSHLRTCRILFILIYLLFGVDTMYSTVLYYGFVFADTYIYIYIYMH